MAEVRTLVVLRSRIVLVCIEEKPALLITALGARSIRRSRDTLLLATGVAGARVRGVGDDAPLEDRLVESAGL